MTIKADRWIKRMALEHRMIEPFEGRQVRAGVISYGLSSYGYDIRVADASQIQGRLILLAAVFLILYSATLTLSPATLQRSWDAGYRWSHWIGTICWLVLFYLAHHFTTRRLPHADPYLLPVALLLGSWGTLSIWRILPYFGMRQTVWSIVAVTVYLVGLYLPDDLSFLRRYKYVWLSSGLLLIALTFLFGTNPSGFGPRLWLGCCGVYLQPSEPLKVLLLIYLAAYLAGMTQHRSERPPNGEPPPKADSRHCFP